MKELAKFQLIINAITNRLEKHTSLTISNKLSFIDSFQYLGSSLDSLIKKLSKGDFKYFSQELDNNV